LNKTSAAQRYVAPRFFAHFAVAPFKWPGSNSTGHASAKGKGVLTMGSAAEFTDSNFAREVLQADVPVLVDFWAPWCPPCRLIAPLIDELARENGGAIKVGKLNIDDGQENAAKYGVEEIPTLLFFKNGEVVERLRGAQPKSRLQRAIDDLKA
jgi:thioredoxin 1